MNEDVDKVLKDYYKSDITLPEGLNKKVFNQLRGVVKEKGKINYINLGIIILNVTFCLLVNVFVGAVIIKVIIYTYLMMCIIGCILTSYVYSKLAKKNNVYTKETVVVIR